MKMSTILLLILRLFQLVQGLVVVGLYGTYLNRAMKADVYADGKWVRLPDSIAPEHSRLIYSMQVFAVTVGSISALAAILYGLAESLLHKRPIGYAFPFDIIVAILWISLTGLFGSMYFSERVEMDKDIQRMKTAAIFDAIGAGLWMVSATVAGFTFKKNRRESGKGSGSRRWFGHNAAPVDMEYRESRY